MTPDAGQTKRMPVAPRPQAKRMNQTPQTGPAPLLEADGLVKQYKDFELDHVNLCVRPGEIVGLVGTNGAGKTTLIKSLLGLVKPDGGGTRLFGVDAQTDDPVLKRHVGVVFDGVSLPSALRVREVRRIMGTVYPTWDDEAFDGYLSRFGLDGRKHVKELSRGMGMKLMLACALSHGADLLILDEATAGLDPMAREEMLDLLRAFMEQDENRGILLATHITSDLEHIADRVACLDAGRLVFDLEKDAITEVAGVAHCRASEFEGLSAQGVFDGCRFRKNALSVDVLVPDRREFTQACPHVAVDSASIEGYMSLALKGRLVGAGASPAAR